MPSKRIVASAFAGECYEGRIEFSTLFFFVKEKWFLNERELASERASFHRIPLILMVYIRISLKTIYLSHSHVSINGILISNRIAANIRRTYVKVLDIFLAIIL